MKKLLKVLLTLVVLGGAGYFGYQYYQSTQVAQSSSTVASTYQMATVQKGNLSQSVTGTGSVSISETEDVKLDYAVTVTGTIVDAGEMVTAGDGLLNIDAEALETTITTLQTELDTCESDMATISNSFSSTSTVTMPLYGRVKEVYISAGQYIENVMAEKGSIALLSLDGRMVVEVDVVDGMEMSSKTKVKVGSTTLEGVVREISGGKAKVSFSDAYGQEGQEVEVFFENKSLGMATAHINTPYLLTTTEKGYISVVYIEANARKWSGNRIAYLTNVPVSEEYKTLQSKRDKLSTQIQDAKALLASGMVNSPIDGIVSTVTDTLLVEQEAKTTLASLYVGDQKEMVVSVDELDIVNVKVGLVADIKMDAISDQTYTATVTRVSQIGTATSGVTVYDVVLSIEGDDRLKIGMNGTATIMIQEVSDVLLVPIGALSTSRDGQYVWLYNESISAESDEPGIKTFVTTGMSDENYAEVLTGLNEGDVLMVTREASTSSTGTNAMNMGGDMMMSIGGGTMQAAPSGSSGGGERPSGGGPGGN